MVGVESALRRFLESPKRRFIVIIVTFGIGLATIWPAADEYSTHCEQYDDLTKCLDDARRNAEELEQLEILAKRKEGLLRELKRRAVSPQSAHLLRGKLVELTRENGCQLRRIHLDPPRQRTWHTTDDPVKRIATAERGSETEFELTTQNVSFSATGSLPSVKRLLAALDEMDRLIHTKDFDLRPLGTNRGEVQLELELILFDLQRQNKDNSA